MVTCRWQAGGVHDLARTTEGIADRFTRWCTAVVARLPFGLNRLVPPTFLGFALINSCTFGVDLALLTIFHGWWGLPIWLSVTVAYVCAFGLSFFLNRTFNFHSHAPVGRQAVVYVVVVAINYLAFILGVGSGLTALGLQYHLSRLLAGACEAVYMYSAMRWVVFRDRTPAPERAAKLGRRRTVRVLRPPVRRSAPRPGRRRPRWRRRR